jgi:SHS2 domain-containing protein
MSYRLLDHTADLALEIAARTRAGLFAEAAAGFTDCLVERSAVRERDRRPLAVAAADDELLLVEWLAELLHAFETDGFLARRAEVSMEDHDRHELSAVLHGERYDPERHGLRVLIKGVTYHALQVCRGEDGWTARVVFDI